MALAKSLFPLSLGPTGYLSTPARISGPSCAAAQASQGTCHTSMRRMQLGKQLTGGYWSGGVWQNPFGLSLTGILTAACGKKTSELHVMNTIAWMRSLSCAKLPKP